MPFVSLGGWFGRGVPPSENFKGWTVNAIRPHLRTVSYFFPRLLYRKFNFNYLCRTGATGRCRIDATGGVASTPRVGVASMRLVTDGILSLSRLTKIGSNAEKMPTKTKIDCFPLASLLRIAVQENTKLGHYFIVW